MDQIHLCLGRLDTGFRFLLERMDHPNIRINLDCIDGAIGIPAMPLRNFKHAALNPFERLGLTGNFAFGGKGQRIEHLVLHLLGKFPEVFARSFQP